MTSTIKVNNVQNQCGQNIINENSNTITIGASGDTIALASGASQTGFGRTGTVNWDTTAKTAGFTGVSGNGYFINTTSGAITVNLPASPSAGDIMAVADYAGTAGTNNITVGRNGSNFQGGTDDALINTERQSVTFVYVDATQGWVPVNSNDQGFQPPAFVTATGGTITTCGDFKIHTFTSPGTFTVSCAGNADGSNTVSYMVVAGGGGGGYEDAGGGGAGGFREGRTTTCSYTVSPLNAPAGLPVSATGYPITVGGGGAGGSQPTSTSAAQGTNGSNSVFSTITSAGGGGGGGGECSTNNGIRQGKNGGSGGGGAGVFAPTPQDGSCGPSGGTGNTPPVTPAQGTDGANGPTLPRQTNNVAELGGGGGGATQAGQRTPSPSTDVAGGAGGNGATTHISGSPTTYAGGGGGGAHPYPGSATGARSSGGSGGGGQGGKPGPDSCKSGTAGTANTGGGGGGPGGNGSTGSQATGTGGSGIVIIRYKFQ